jgi:hypothetical protein
MRGRKLFRQNQHLCVFVGRIRGGRVGWPIGSTVHRLCRLRETCAPASCSEVRAMASFLMISAFVVLFGAGLVLFRVLL